MYYCKCFYCRHFTEWQTNRHKWYLPLERLWVLVWFAIPRYINNKNWAKRDELGYRYTREGEVPKVPFLGMIFEKEEGKITSWKWWKYIKIIKRN